jgi:hypothetical protein
VKVSIGGDLIEHEGSDLVSCDLAKDGVGPNLGVNFDRTGEQMTPAE